MTTRVLKAFGGSGRVGGGGGGSRGGRKGEGIRNVRGSVFGKTSKASDIAFRQRYLKEQHTAIMRFLSPALWGCAVGGYRPLPGDGKDSWSVLDVIKVHQRTLHCGG